MASFTDRAAVVIDTQIVLDWVLFGDPRVQPWTQAIVAQRIRWLYTAAMLAEALRVAQYPALSRRFDAQQSTDKLSQAFSRWGEPCTAAPQHAQLRCIDRDDQMFIDLALARQARWLLSRDRAVLRLARRAQPFGLDIAAPEQAQPPG